MINFLGVTAVIVTMMTAYNPIPNQTDNSPLIASRNKGVQACTVAISRSSDLGVKLGDRICIALPALRSCYYEVKAWDRLNWRKMSTQLDLFLWELESAKQFGIKKGVQAYVVQDGTECSDLPRHYIGDRAHEMFNSVKGLKRSGESALADNLKSFILNFKKR